MDCSDISTIEEAARTIIVCVASSYSWVDGLADFLPPTLILLSVSAAVWGISAARATARKRATLDMIEKVESTPHYRAMHAVFSYHRRTNGFARLHNPLEEKDKSERQSVLDYLNHYELVAIGIQKGILDAEIYQDWMLGPFVRDWNAARPFVQRERWKWDDAGRRWVYRKAAFSNYQTVACTWSRDALTLTAESIGPPATAEGPGDEILPNGNSAGA